MALFDGREQSAQGPRFILSRDVLSCVSCIRGTVGLGLCVKVKVEDALRVVGFVNRHNCLAEKDVHACTIVAKGMHPGSVALDEQCRRFDRSC